MNRSITILGGGNMGGALARAWHRKNHHVRVIETDGVRAAALRSDGIAVEDSLNNAAGDMLVLAIKPQQYDALKEAVKNSSARCVVSIMAGVTALQLAELAPRVVRAMPNLPAQIGAGVTGLYTPDADEVLRQEITDLFAAVGQTLWVREEDRLHAITAITGSGPGYVFAFMDACYVAALEQGFSAAEARALVTATLKGATLLAEASAHEFAALAQQVASPGGTTEAGLTVLTNGGLKRLIRDTVSAAEKRSREMSS